MAAFSPLVAIPVEEGETVNTIAVLYRMADGRISVGSLEVANKGDNPLTDREKVKLLRSLADTLEMRAEVSDLPETPDRD